MSKQDYYDILGVSRDSNDEEIKKAYRKKAMEYHPDRNQGDASAEAKFKEIGEAFSILSEPDKRARYDRLGHAGLGAQEGFGDFDFGSEGFDPFELFRSVFNGFGGDIFGRTSTGRRSRVRRGSDLKLDLNLTLDDVTGGITKKVKVRYLKKCESCNGSGSINGKSVKCPRCNGAGEVRQITESFFGRMVNVTACGYCHGEGKIVKDPCGNCRGEGVERAEKTINIGVPAGVTSGNYLRLKGEGNAGPHNGLPGDIIVTFHERPHDLFTRHGDDVLLALEIPYSQAVLGASVEVPTLTGKVRLTIPAGTPPGKLFRVRGQGIGHLDSLGRGDQIVKVTVHVPSKVSTEERKLLEELQSLQSNREKSFKPFFSKVKDLFS